MMAIFLRLRRRLPRRDWPSSRRRLRRVGGRLRSARGGDPFPASSEGERGPRDRRQLPGRRKCAIPSKGRAASTRRVTSSAEARFVRNLVSLNLRLSFFFFFLFLDKSKTKLLHFQSPRARSINVRRSVRCRHVRRRTALVAHPRRDDVARSMR